MTNPRNFSSRVPHVTAGSAVTAGNTSAATRSLEQRTNYLREVIEAIEAGSLLVRRDQRLDVEVNEGDAVFWNSVTQQYEQALAGVTNDAESSTLAPTPSSDCLGICMVKDGPRVGTIALLGMVKLSSTVLNNMIDGTASAGRYYLSAANPGKLVQQRPPVSVAVAVVLGPSDSCEEDSWVFINPQMRDFLEDHIHYQFELTAAPAGTHTQPAEGEDHVITAADADLPGWLPADHESFDGTAPAGAVFGYNIAAHEALSRVWPPIPAAAAVLEMHQRNISSVVTGFDGYARVPADYVTIDQRGIWWMTSCYNQVPWDTTLDTTQSVNASLSSVAATTCPEDPPTSLLLSFLKMTFATDKTVVTSLQPATDQPIEFVNCDGTTATTGDLYARLNVLSLLDPVLVDGGLVMKEIVDSSLKFRRGWVTEGLYAGSSNIILAGTHQRLLDEDAVASDNNPLVHQGMVRVDVQLDTGDRELNPEVIRLGDAIEREYKGITYLAFQAGRDSGIRMRYNVPTNGIPTNPQLVIRALIFGHAVGPFAEMTMAYYRIVRPTDGVPTVIAEGDTALTFDVVTPTDDYDGLGTNLPAYNAIEVVSDAFNIAAGDTVFVELQRASNATPLYGSEIGVIRINGIIVAEDV